VRDILARWRVTLGFVSGVAVFWLAQPTALSLAVGVATASVGEGLRIWAAGHLNKAQEVTSSGPYGWFAHPLYIGSSIMGAGLAVASDSPIAALLIAIYLGATLTAAIRSEEAFLRRTFGDQYDRYRGGARGASSHDARPFSAALAIANHEHRTAVGVLVAVLLLVLKATYNGLFWRAAAGG